MRWNLGKLRHQHMMSAPLGTFHSHNFKSIMLTVLGMQPFKYVFPFGPLLRSFSHFSR